MVDKDSARTRRSPFQELAKRLGVALSARALWTLAVRLIDHH